MNEDNQITKTLTSWDEIEEAIIKYNWNHLKQAHYAEIYQDQICKSLKKDKTRNKILSRALEQGDCDNENVYQFLKLLKTLQFTSNQPTFIPISIKE